MKTLYTSYYGKVNKLPKTAQLIQTSTKAPEFLGKMERAKFEPDLVPTKFFINQEIRRAGGTPDWKSDYRTQLEQLYRNGVLQAIVANLPEGAVMLCYEADECNCHRHLIAQFLNEKGLARVSEFAEEKKAEPQLSLF